MGGSKEPRPERRRKEDPCKELRLAIVVGSGTDDSIKGAANWILERARALGGTFHMWIDQSPGDPLDSFRDHDISDGRQRPDSERFTPDYNDTDIGLSSLLADCQNCRGRIVELVIFHHGAAVDESVLADRIRSIFNAIKIPICKVVWWACNAAVSLDVERYGAHDMMMKILGAISRCEPCGCDGPIELVWPTAGFCYLSDDGDEMEPQTNDGNVHSARWGYRQPDGSLGKDPAPPQPGDPHPSPEPPDRDPPNGQPPNSGPGEVLGVPVTQKS